MVRSRGETSGEAGEYMGMSRGGNIRKHQEKQGNRRGRAGEETSGEPEESMVRSREETSGEAGEYMGMSRGGNIRRIRGLHGDE